ncbi:MAG: YtxH domain-containing protein [Bacteroidales bacterium]|jgi:gas vesicle protein|nr:YtxH domain-containing protein [Bacteroidales bacterium]MBR3572764.1 YtxH domain-containing protein [Bacteroidales bacterium]
MKASEIFAFVAGAAAATGITLLFTTEKGKHLREEMEKNLSKEEIDKLIEKLKRKRETAPDADVEDQEVGGVEDDD